MLIEFAASVIVVMTAIYLIGLAVIAIFAPATARGFLNQFASSARAHYAEMLVRLCVGYAFVLYAPHMLWSEAFGIFGWVLLASSAVLLLLPWRWHQRFAQKVVPPITDRAWLFGLVSLPLGGVILFAVLAGR